MIVTPRTLPFHFVDVFAVAPLTGNPLVVVEDAGNLPLRVLQQIAREFNQSETTFVLPATRAGADWRLRSFTPAGAEVFGAGGHNTLGAWWWLAEAGRLALTGRLTVFHQEVGDRVLPVTISDSGWTPGARRNGTGPASCRATLRRSGPARGVARSVRR